MKAELNALHDDFDSRHQDIESVLLKHFAKVESEVFTDRPLSRSRRLLIGVTTLLLILPKVPPVCSWEWATRG